MADKSQIWGFCLRCGRVKAVGEIRLIGQTLNYSDIDYQLGICKECQEKETHKDDDSNA